MYDDLGAGIGNCTIGRGDMIHQAPCTGCCGECNTDCCAVYASLHGGTVDNCMGICQSEQIYCNGLTNEQMELNYVRDEKTAEKTVNEQINIPLTQEQFDALVSFAFNRGTVGNRPGSGFSDKIDVQKLINNYQFEKAAQAFNEYVFSGGAKQGGLIRRRPEESQLFRDGYYIYYQWAWYYPGEANENNTRKP